MTFMTTMVILASLSIGWYVSLSLHVNCLAIYILALTFLPKTCFLVYNCRFIPLSILHATLVSSLAIVISFFFLASISFTPLCSPFSLDLLQVPFGSKDPRPVVELFKLLSLISNVFLILPPLFFYFYFYFFETLKLDQILQHPSSILHPYRRNLRRVLRWWRSLWLRSKGVPTENNLKSLVPPTIHLVEI